MIEVKKIKKYLEKILNADKISLEKILPNLISKQSDNTDRELYDYRLSQFKRKDNFGYEIEINNILNKASEVKQKIQELIDAFDGLKLATNVNCTENKCKSKMTISEKRQHLSMLPFPNTMVMDGLKEIPKEELHSFLFKSGTKSNKNRVTIPHEIMSELGITENTDLIIAIKKALPKEVEEYTLPKVDIS